MITAKLRVRKLGRSKWSGDIEVTGETFDIVNHKIILKFCEHLVSSPSSISFYNGNIFAGFHKVGEYEVLDITGVEIEVTDKDIIVRTLAEPDDVRGLHETLFNIFGESNETPR